MALRRFGFCGDSISAGWVYGHSTELGGPGSFPQLIAEKLGNISGVGPLIGSGIRPVSLNETFQTSPFATASEWNYQGRIGIDWTKITASTTDKGLYGYTYYSTSVITVYTVPTQWRKAKYIQLYYIDTASGADWNIIFRDTDLNSTTASFHTDLHYTLLNDLKIHSIFLDLTGWLGSTQTLERFTIQPQSGTVMPMAVELFWQDPRSVDGLVVDNCAQSGRQLRELVDTTSGSDRMAIFDSVVANADPGVTLASGIKTGTPVSNRPTLGVLLEHMNDAKLQTVAQYNTDLRTFDARLSPVCPTGYWNTYELAPVQSVSPPGGIDPTVQANFRAQMTTTTSSLGRPLFDMFNAFTSRGWSNYADAYYAGLLHDDAHENAYGHRVLAEYLYGFIRKTFLPGRLAPSVGPWRMNQQKLLGTTDLAGTPGPPGSVAAFQAGAARASGESVYT